MRFKCSLISIIYKLVSSFCRTCTQKPELENQQKVLDLLELIYFESFARDIQETAETRKSSLLFLLNNGMFGLRSLNMLAQLGRVRCSQRRQTALESADQISPNTHLDINNFIKTSCHPPHMMVAETLQINPLTFEPLILHFFLSSSNF